MLTKFFVSAAALLSLTTIVLAQESSKAPKPEPSKPAPMATKQKSEPKKGELKKSESKKSESKKSEKASGPVSLNKATAAELESLPGIGPATASRILEHRNAQGKFHDLSELLSIKGIGEKRLAQLRPRLTLD
jgi:competence protein ComEA